MVDRLLIYFIEIFVKDLEFPAAAATGDGTSVLLFGRLCSLIWVG